MNKLVFASTISEIQQSDIFMSVKARICEAPKANLNGARVTEAFIDEIVDNPKRYVGLPLYADVRALISGNYRRLGHLYDSRTGEFHSTQIGSFYQFEKEEFETGSEKGCYLIGYARIAKRNKKLSKAISELFADNALKFSFEIAVGEYEELDDNTILIDASENNYLEGTAIVADPACQEAVALELVAQKKDAAERSENEMQDAMEEKVEVTAEQDPVETTETQEPETQAIAEEEKPEETPEENACDNREKAEEESACNYKEKAEEEDASCKKRAEDENGCNDEEKAETEEACNTKKYGSEETISEVLPEETSETAAVVVRETETMQNSVSLYDTETNTEVSQNVVVETTTFHVEPEASLVQTDEGVTIAEDNVQVIAGDPVDLEDGDSGDDSEADSGNDAPVETIVQPGDEATKKTAEQLIAELAETIESLKKEIAELKETKAVAEVKSVSAEINPFVDPIHTQKKYTLLEKEEPRTNYYSLLERD